MRLPKHIFVTKMIKSCMDLAHLRGKMAPFFFLLRDLGWQKQPKVIVSEKIPKLNNFEPLKHQKQTWGDEIWHPCQLEGYMQYLENGLKAPNSFVPGGLIRAEWGHPQDPQIDLLSLDHIPTKLRLFMVKISCHAEKEQNLTYKKSNSNFLMD